MRTILRALFFVIFPFFGTTSHANMIVDFEEFSEYTLITNQLQNKGLLVVGDYNSGLFPPGPGAILDTVNGAYNVRDFGGSGSKALYYGTQPQDSLTLRFVNPDGSPRIADFVSLRIGDGDFLSETFEVTIRDLADSLLYYAQFTTTNGPVGGGVTVSLSLYGIHSINVHGLHTSGGAVDDIAYHLVETPEPSTGFIFAASILLFLLSFNRKCISSKFVLMTTNFTKLQPG